MPRGQAAAQYEPEIPRNTRWYNPTADTLVSGYAGRCRAEGRTGQSACGSL